MERGAAGAQVALAWLLQRPGVTAPIVGATKAAHVDDAIAAEELELTPDEVTRLEEGCIQHAVRARVGTENSHPAHRHPWLYSEAMGYRTATEE